MQDILAEAELFLQPASVISQLLRGGSRIQHFTLEQYFDRVSADRCRQHSSSKMAGLDFVGRELCRRLRVKAEPNFKRIPAVFGVSFIMAFLGQTVARVATAYCCASLFKK